MATAYIGHRGLLVLALLALAGCASGPSDFVEMAADAPPRPTVRTEVQRGALERDLTATGARQGARGAAADAGLPSAMALAVIRQQQTEEAKALLAEATAGKPPAANEAGAAPAPACSDGVAGCPAKP